MRVLIVENTSEGQALAAKRLESIDRVDKDTLDLSVSLTDEHSVLDRLSNVDVVVLGSSLGDHATKLSKKIKLAKPTLEIIMCVSREAYSGGAFRSALAHGVRKVFSDAASLLDIVQELMSIHEEFRICGRVKTGRVIAVIQAKGGIGVTSTCAALGEVCSAYGESTMLWDLDIETRDLCRALMVEGNEPAVVRSWIDGSREVSRDSLRQALMKVTPNVSILPPPDQMSIGVDLVGKVDAIELVQSIINLARVTHNNVIVDTAGRIGPATAAIVRNADAVVVMIDDSILGLTAARYFMSTLQSVVRNTDTLHFLCSGISVPQAQVAEHIENQFNFGSKAWRLPVIPFDSAAAKWPGSGKTLYSAGRKNTKQALEQIAAGLQMIELKKPEPIRLLSHVTQSNSENQLEGNSQITGLSTFRLLWQRLAHLQF